MNIKFVIATVSDSDVIANFVIKLTEEICVTTNVTFFSISFEETLERCRELIRRKHYGAIIGYMADQPIAISTFTESYALYAGGKIGIIPEFYIDPGHRSSGVGTKLIAAVKDYGRDHGWSCIELCTPPLPEFERTLAFYQKSGLIPVGGRKMRQYL